MEASQGSESNLLTDQPDEPAPSAQEAAEGLSGRPVSGALPSTDSEIYGTPPVDQAQRDAQLEADAQRHNERTGGGTVVEGEREAQREEHRVRTGDGDGTETDGFQSVGPLGQQGQGVQPVGATDAPPGPSTDSPSSDPAPSPNPTGPPAEEPSEPAQSPQNPAEEPQNPPAQ